MIVVTVAPIVVIDLLLLHIVHHLFIVVVLRVIEVHPDITAARQGTVEVHLGNVAVAHRIIEVFHVIVVDRIVRLHVIAEMTVKTTIQNVGLNKTPIMIIINARTKPTIAVVVVVPVVMVKNYRLWHKHISKRSK